MSMRVQHVAFLDYTINLILFFCKVLHEILEDIRAICTSAILQYKQTIKHTIVQVTIGRIPNPRIRLDRNGHLRIKRTSSSSDDADGVECLPNEVIFAELARMGYEKPPPKLTFYKAFFSAQWKFLIHMIVQCMSAKRTIWNEFSSFMASAVICLATEQDKVAQALKITKLKHRVKMLERQRRSKHFGLKRLRKFGGKIADLDANNDVTLVDVDTAVEIDVDTQGRMEEDVTPVKEIKAAEPEPTVFNDEEVTITMA
uniref:Synaptobrevin, longin-like domain protein n=1 Tax=Tanacetum cinerariifolium TaxID=118510 RepID=A0A6L2KPD8_TANCI|nr:hypothetical protein [Tanacetum cinerariifolium]